MNEVIEFEGEDFKAQVLKLKGGVDLGDHRPHRGERIATLAESKVSEVAMRSVKDVPTLVRTATIERGVIIDAEYGRDILDEHTEQTTGQLKLLSLDGEGRRAARSFLTERRRAVDLGWGPEAHDKLELDDITGKAHEYTQRIPIEDYDEATFDSTTEGAIAWLEAQLRNTEKAGGLLIAAAEWLRRRLNEQHELLRESQRLAADEARAREEAAEAVHSDETADKADRRAVNPDMPDPDNPAGVDEEAAAAMQDAIAQLKDEANKTALPSQPEPDAASGVAVSDAPAGEASVSTQKQRIAIATQLAQIRTDERLTSEYLAWCSNNGVPESPMDMTRDQARALLLFLGDKDNAG